MQPPDKKMYQKAEAFYKGKENSRKWNYQEKFYKGEPENQELGLNESEIAKYMELFVGREDVYAVDSIINYKRHVEDVLQPLLPDKVKQHLDGRR